MSATCEEANTSGKGHTYGRLSSRCCDTTSQQQHKIQAYAAQFDFELWKRK